MVIGPKPVFNHIRWCGFGKHAKRALERGGSCANPLLRRPKLPTPVNQPKTPKKGHYGRWEIS